MLRTFFAFVAIKWRRETMGMVVAYKTADDLVGRHSLLGCSINFDAIAGAEHQRLITTAIPQRAVGLDMAGKVFARLDVRVVMTETDAEQIHGVCVWAAKAIAPRKGSAAPKPIMLS